MICLALLQVVVDKDLVNAVDVLGNDLSLRTLQSVRQEVLGTVPTVRVSVVEDPRVLASGGVPRADHGLTFATARAECASDLTRVLRDSGVADDDVSYAVVQVLQVSKVRTSGTELLDDLVKAFHIDGCA